MIAVIAAVSILVTLIFFAVMIVDILKTILAKIKKQKYEWQSAKAFCELDEWWKPLLLALILAIGTYNIFTGYRNEQGDAARTEHERFSGKTSQLYANIIDCPYCGEDFPQEYSFESYEGSVRCPLCAREDLDALMSAEILKCWVCGSYYYPLDSDGFGLCWDCCKEMLADCQGCGDRTFKWANGLDFSLCIHCAGDVTSSNDVIDAIYNYWE